MKQFQAWVKYKNELIAIFDLGKFNDIAEAQNKIGELLIKNSVTFYLPILIQAIEV